MYDKRPTFNHPNCRLGTAFRPNVGDEVLGSILRIVWDL